MAFSQYGVPGVPPPTKLVDEWADRRPSLWTSNNNSPGSGDVDNRLADILARLDECSESIRQLKDNQDDLAQKQEEFSQKHDLFYQKQEEGDSVRRSQIDCISKRVFDAEKQLSESKEVQDDAIAKANAVFVQHAAQVEQERSNLMSVIGQVNRNFEHLSHEMAEHSNDVKGSCQDVLRMQTSIEEFSYTISQQAAFVRQSIASLQEQTHEALQTHQENIFEMLAGHGFANAGVHRQSDRQDERENHPAGTRLTSNQQRRPTMAKDMAAEGLDLDAPIASERGAGQRGSTNRDPWRGEAQAMPPEPTEMAQPSFCSRQRRTPELAPDSDEIYADHRPPVAGTGFLFSSQSRLPGNMHAQPTPEQQFPDPQQSFGFWGEEVGRDAEARRGSPSPSGMPGGLPRGPDAARLPPAETSWGRQFGVPGAPGGDVRDDSDESDQDESYSDADDYTHLAGQSAQQDVHSWGMDGFGYGLRQDTIKFSA